MEQLGHPRADFILLNVDEAEIRHERAEVLVQDDSALIFGGIIVEHHLGQGLLKFLKHKVPALSRHEVSLFLGLSLSQEIVLFLSPLSVLVQQGRHVFRAF